MENLIIQTIHKWAANIMIIIFMHTTIIWFLFSNDKYPAVCVMNNQVIYKRTIKGRDRLFGLWCWQIFNGCCHLSAIVIRCRLERNLRYIVSEINRGIA